MNRTRNHTHLILSLAVAASTVAMAERQPLWPEGAMPDRQPHQIAAMTDEANAPEFDFDAATPPILFVHGDADGWAAMNSVKAWEQLRRIGVQGEVHTLVFSFPCFHG